MSNWPPPPPPPFDRNASRAQRRYFKEQLRAQRRQWKMQMRALRRTSVVAPVLLIAVGVLFLLVEAGHLAFSTWIMWYSHWWPVLMLLVGVTLLAEWIFDQRVSQTSGQPVILRRLGGLSVLLLILLVFTGLASNGVIHSLDAGDRIFGSDFRDFYRSFGEQRSDDQTLTTAVTPGSTVTVRNAHGDINITGLSLDGQMHITAHKEAGAWHSSDLDRRMSELTPRITNDAAGHTVTVEIDRVSGGNDDLSIELPAAVALNVDARHGDIKISGIHGAVSLASSHGDLDLSGLQGNVYARMDSSGSTIGMHDIHGDVLVEGRAGDVSIKDISGSVALKGDYYGTTHCEHITGSIRFNSSRTQFEAARLDGEFDIESGSLTMSDASGPVVIATREKHITLDRITGPVNVTNRNGEVELTSVAPVGTILIHNEHGSVEVGLPSASGYAFDAQTRNGDISNDFDLNVQGDSTKTARGTTGNGAVSVTVSTTDNDISLHKSSAVAAPPTPPTPPSVRSATPPAPPSPPAAPGAKHLKGSSQPQDF